MNVNEEFQAAALEVFDSFGDLIIDAEYQQTSTGYVAGGAAPSVEATYDIRLIRDSRRSELSIASDIPRDTKKYLFITNELAVEAKSKDKISVDGSVQSIIAVDTDPADAITTIWVG